MTNNIEATALTNAIEHPLLRGAENVEATIRERIESTKHAVMERLQDLGISQEAVTNFGNHMKDLGPTVMRAITAGAIVGTLALKMFKPEEQKKPAPAATSAVTTPVTAPPQTIPTTTEISTLRGVVVEEAFPSTSTYPGTSTRQVPTISGEYGIQDKTQAEKWAEASQLAAQIGPYEKVSPNAFAAIDKWVAIMEIDNVAFSPSTQSIVRGIYLKEAGTVGPIKGNSEVGLMQTTPDTIQATIYDAALETDKLTEVCTQLGISKTNTNGTPKTRPQLQAEFKALTQTNAEAQIAVGVMAYANLYDKYQSPQLAALAYNRPQAAQYLEQVAGNPKKAGMLFDDLIRTLNHEETEFFEVNPKNYYVMPDTISETNGANVPNVGLTFTFRRMNRNGSEQNATLYGLPYVIGIDHNIKTSYDKSYDGPSLDENKDKGVVDFAQLTLTPNRTKQVTLNGHKTTIQEVNPVDPRAKGTRWIVQQEQE